MVERVLDDDDQNDFTLLNIDISKAALHAKVSMTAKLGNQNENADHDPISAHDPMQNNQWYLDGGWGTNASAVWNDYTGQGINIGILDDGFDFNHSDLSNNFDSNSSRHYDLNNQNNDASYGSGDFHGTNVAGVIGAEDNGSGIVGIAYDSNLYGYQIDFSQGISPSMLADLLNNYVTPNADVFNNSWGFTSSFAGNFNSGWGTLETAIINSVDTGRGGLGTNIVFSAGNNRADGDDVNHSNLNNSPYTIAVAAHHEFGDHTGFSNEGAALLVSGPGQSMLTTDNSGSAGASSGDYYTTSGTSYSAPAVSAVIGLMLDANENLGYRDVQEILAYSSRHINSSDSGWAFNGAGNLNGGGLHFSHDFGFGAVDAHAAVRMAETWDFQQTYDGSVSGSEGLSTVTGLGGTISTSDGGTVTDSIVISTDIEIEQVIVNVDISHSQAGDLTVVLVSPDGTESHLLSRPNTYGSNGQGLDNPGSYSGSLLNWDLSSNAHWGESSAGTWELRVTDSAGNGSGTVTWNIEFLGNAHRTDDVYFYTNEFSNVSGGTNLTDTDGGTDTINAAAVTSGSTIDLSGGTSTIDGKNLTISTSIENIYSGDGEDILTGNAASNSIAAGRGNDTVNGSQGDDTLDGQQGLDEIIFGVDVSEFLINVVDSVTVTLEHIAGSLGLDTLLNFETYTFNGTSYTHSELGDINTPLPGSKFKAEFGNDRYIHLSESVENFTVTADDAGFTGATGDLFTIDRTVDSTTLTILNNTVPETLSLGGTANDDQLTFNGTAAVFNGNIGGGAGDDTITATGFPGAFDIRGHSGDDIINSGDGGDKLSGGDGSDTVNAAGGDDRVFGNSGNDELNGGNGHDELYGMDGQDTLNGDSGFDRLYGGADNDILNGGAGFDRLNGDGGDDTLYGGAGDDKINGGAGTDTLDFSSAAGAIDVRLYKNWVRRDGDGGQDDVWEIENVTGTGHADLIVGDANANSLNGAGGRDDLRGGGGDDELIGGGDRDRLDGDDGQDTLNGGRGDDFLFGGDGDDTLYGDQGIDALFGGSGADTFAWSAATFDTSGDRIRDFSTSDGDRLDISDILTGFTNGVSDIDDFLRFDAPAGDGDISVAVDRDGTGSLNNFQYFAQIENPGGPLDAQTLFDNGNIVT